MESLIDLLHDAVKVFLTVFATAGANKLVKKLSNKDNKKTALSRRKRGGSKRK
ncbi:TPA: hypothetical protein ACQUHP_006409 [Bacillus cereus]